MAKFKGKYRIPSSRLPNWNYGQNGSYFVTICTRGRICHFGNIANAKFCADPAGKIALNKWMEIPRHFPFVQLGAFVVMPNHVHGILTINKNDGEAGTIAGDRKDTAEKGVGPGKPGGITGHHNPMLHENLSRILRRYKGGVTFECRKLIKEFGWQPRFHDHIIRNAISYAKIENYIHNNPSNWKDDTFYRKK